MNSQSRRALRSMINGYYIMQSCNIILTLFFMYASWVAHPALQPIGFVMVAILFATSVFLQKAHKEEVKDYIRRSKIYGQRYPDHI